MGDGGRGEGRLRDATECRLIVVIFVCHAFIGKNTGTSDGMGDGYAIGLTNNIAVLS